MDRGKRGKEILKADSLLSTELDDMGLEPTTLKSCPELNQELGAQQAELPGTPQNPQFLIIQNENILAVFGFSG